MSQQVTSTPSYTPTNTLDLQTMAYRGDDDLPEEETDLRNPDVVTKYKAAADICNRKIQS